MKTLALIVVSLLFAGCVTVPPPLEGRWEVDNKTCTVGVGEKSLVEVVPLRRNLFRVKIEGARCGKDNSPANSATVSDLQAAALQVVTTGSTAQPGRCQENQIDEADEKNLIAAFASIGSLEKFDELAGGKIHTFMSGMGYLRDSTERHPELHLVTYLSYVIGSSCDKKQRKYLLAINSLDPRLATHNGVIHGKP